MLTIAEYLKPQSIAEAYHLLKNKENSVIIGGGFFTRMSSRKIGAAIDLSDARLNEIRETEQAIEIGAMVNFSQLEKDTALIEYFDGIIPATVANLPGQQMRNMVSVGGTIYGKYGFSELLTVLMVLDCQVVLYQGGVMELTEFLNLKGKPQDILEKIIIKKENLKASYKMFRYSSGSLPILTVAVSEKNNQYKIAVGARPAMAALAIKTMEYLNSNEQTDDSPLKAAEIAAGELVFGVDRRASGEYRQELCKVLVKRAILEVNER